MSISLSRRVDWVVQSEIRNMSIECEKFGGINLAQGVADTCAPSILQRAAKNAITRGMNSYTRHDGASVLRQAICRKQERFTGMTYDPETEVVVSAGATGAFYSVCLSLLNPGDEVIVFEPYYGYHISTLVSVEALPRYVRLEPPEWRLSEKALERTVTSKTKAIVINTPANPTGKIFERAELEIVAKIAKRYDLFIFTDEIYEHFVYDGCRHVSPATLPGMKKRTITVSGLSKTYSITGWRIGYALCDREWAKAIGYFSDLVYVCAPSPLQIGAAEGLLKLGKKYYSALSSDYCRKRDKICAALRSVDLTPFVPKGAYYVLADLTRIKGLNGKQKVMTFLKETKVAAVPGEAFYSDSSGENLARFCFAKKDDVLNEACRRIRRS